VLLTAIVLLFVLSVIARVAKQSLNGLPRFSRNDRMPLPSGLDYLFCIPNWYFHDLIHNNP